MQIQKRTRRALQVMVMAALMAALANAQTAAYNSDSLQILLDVLRDKGMITEQEYDTIRQRAAAAPKAAPTQQTHEPAQEQAAETLAKPEPDKTVRMMDKGVGVHMGPVDVSLSGEINVFYDHDRPDRISSTDLINGGLTSTGTKPTSSVRNGLLPGNFSISLTTQQKGFDVGVTFGFYPGLNSVSGVGGANSSGNASGFGTSGIDFRQQFASVSRSDFGTVKAGRDIGFFGQEAILNDITLLGVGSPDGNIAPSNTSLGRIGLGYVYTDFIPQISYFTPRFSGLQFALGVFTPLNAVNFSGLSGTLTGHDEPQIQAKLTYNTPEKKSLKLSLWSNGITQHMIANAATDALAVGHGLQASGVDFGAKLSAGPVELVGYGYSGWGLGSTGLFFDAVSVTGIKRDSHGYYFQGAYTIRRWTLGASYGLSHLDSADLADSRSSLFKNNDSEVGVIRYKLTDWVNLVTEYTRTNSSAHNGATTNADSIAAGSILFFGH